MECRIILFLLLITNSICLNEEEEILGSIGALLAQTTTYKYPKDYSEFRPTTTEDGGEYGTYDFIIIGAGSAGTLLANRLSAIPDWSILLLEAGKDDSTVTDVPNMAGALQFSGYNWGYQSTPQKNCCLGMVNRQCNIPRGKVLGGSSTINFMIYTRGNKADYDKWSDDGNPGWSYEEILPYFIKMEDSHMTHNVDESYHGKNGTLSVEHVRNYGEFEQAFLDAQKELGRNILDYNGKDEMGYSRVQSNTINGRRCSGNKAFLKPVSKRENLKIVKKAFVTKVLINNDDDVSAWGVEFYLGSKKYYAKTKIEVVLSAGAVASPQILLHSGIGPKEELNSLGIESIVDLPVGQNLHDHPVFAFPFATNYTDPSAKPLPEMVSDYLNGFGLLTTAGNIQSLGFINTGNASASFPDIEQIISPHFDMTNGSVTKLANFDEDVTEAYLAPYGNNAAVYMQAFLSAKSRGSVKLKSKDVFDHPLIDFNYFEYEEDVAKVVKGLKDFLRVLETPAMQKYNSRYLHNPIPQCPQEFMSDDYLECLVRYTSFSIYHLAGTCKMGPEGDLGSVVDHELKVRGVANLRVVDASIIPEPIAAHTNAPTYMIAAKVSEDILKKWKTVCYAV